MPMLSIRLFGRPEIFLDKKSVKLARRKSRALLFYAAAHIQPVPREAVLDLLWIDLPRPAALQTLRTSLYGIKQVLGEAVQIDQQFISLSPQVAVDAREFQTGLERAEDHVEGLEQTLSLYAGEFMQGFQIPDSAEFEDWINLEREHYRQIAIRNFAQLATHHKNEKNYRLAIDNLNRALTIQPLQEDLHRERILLHFLAGDRPAAIQQYDALRKLLDRELGVPPMAETRALYDQILTDHAPTVSAAKSVRAVSPRKAAKTSPAGLPFVGRKSELNELQLARQAGKFALIEGEPGIGKTRLASEYLQTSEALGLIGVARELEQNLPYQPVIEALRSILNSPKWSPIQEKIEKQLSPVWAAEVSRFLPELSRQISPQVEYELKVDESRLWEGIRQLLTVIASNQAVVLVMDDIQWAGDSTLGLLGYLVRQGGIPDLFIMGTARPTSPSLAFRTFLQSLSRQDLIHKVALSRLLPGDIQQLARHLSAQYAPPLAEWLQTTSEGNPYILTELVKYARQKKLIRPDGTLNLSDLSAEPLIPQTVYQLIQSHLESLSDAARRILDAGVAMGRKFNFDLVTFAAGISEQAALDAMDELLDQGLVRPEQGKDFIIEHSLIMEVAYQEVGELRHRFLHRRIAEAMEALQPSGLEQKAGFLARHFSEAGETKRAAVYARLAGKQAADLAAWHEAIDYYQIALNSSDEANQVEDWKALADAHAKAGEFAQATQAYHEALTQAKKGGLPESELSILQLSMARSMLPQARYQEVIEIAQKVCEKAGVESMMIAELIWGTALSIEGSDLDGAQEHLQAAETLWQQNPAMPVSTLAQIEFESGSVAAQQGKLELAIAYYQKSLQAALESKDSYSLEQSVLAYNNLAYHKHLHGDADAQKEAMLGLELAQKFGILGMQTYLYSTLGEIAMADGEDARAETYFKKGLELAERFSISERVAGITANLGLLARQRGQTDLAMHYLSTALGQAQSLGTLHLEAQIHLWLAPLLPSVIGRQHLNQAREIAGRSGRALLLEEVNQLEETLGRSSD